MQFITKRGQHSRCKNIALVLKAGGGVRFHSLGGASRTFSYRNLARWRHVDTISALLFSMVAGFAVAITIFSVRQTSHRRVPHLYGAAWCTMSHLI